MSERDLSWPGTRMGKYLVTEKYEIRRGGTYWYCICECGNSRYISAGNLKRQCSQGCNSCGNTRHGMSRTYEYLTWMAMRCRCNNPEHDNYKNYGGRGIKVCDRWDELFVNFFADMGPRPSPKHSLDRINNDGNYEPGNCRWATAKEQSRNRRNTIKLTFYGKTQSLSEWAEEYGLTKACLAGRLRVSNDPDCLFRKSGEKFIRHDDRRFK